MFNLYENNSYNSVNNAINELEGRTHYYSKSTRKFHGSSVVYANITDKGLLMATVEKYSVDHNHTKKRFRPVIFDIFGSIVGNRPSLEDGYTNKDKAVNAMWAQLESLNAKKITREGIKNFQDNTKRDIKNLRAQLKDL